ncbi:hypothetical protein N7462_002537 [Penicillium macrosclerotiorum]|uniref:uncharacterized protein n=1 Tax=Penicillium macrosclerotiorum TaxID=303699 RepID=UPI00254845EA|nr:uncharacterized protein N7462_002537 [Penicillium macrosclerotiorum]KAJ5693114.1 hypothetical protein N7462_002537 [Penicillium macrosclerotiorum]
MTNEGYYPRLSDSAQAGAVLADDFLETFKQSLLTDYKSFVQSEEFVHNEILSPRRSSTHTPFRDVQPSRQPPCVHDELQDDRERNTERNHEPSITAATVPGIGSMGVSVLNYPLSLFDNLPELPPASIIEDLTWAFETGFLRKAPFLSDLSNPDTPALAGLAGMTPVPPYLAFSRALIGTVVTRRQECCMWAPSLYETALKLFVGSVELDNRTSRNIHWYEAGLLLVVYGMLHSDDAIWETTTIVNGYFLVPYKHRGFLQIADQGAPFDTHDTSLITSFYFVIDIIRAIHLNTPPSFSPTDLSFPLTDQSTWRFEDLYRQIIIHKRPLSPDQTPGEYLLAILCILSEVFQLLKFLGPFVDETTQNPHMADVNSIFYPPSSASREYLRQIEGLICSLQVWHSSIDAQSARSSNGCQFSNASLSRGPNSATLKLHRDSLPIAYMCRILLELGPRALELPKIAGYDGPLPNGHNPPSPLNDKPHQLGIHVSDSAIECSWKILETLDDEGHDVDCTVEDSFIPLWLPLVLFYAGLTVWARMQEDQDRGLLKGAQNSPSARRRLLRSFENELRKIGRQYKSAARMADVIKKLYSCTLAEISV